MGRRPCITVLAGTNGAGKSSIAGATIRRRKADYYNPDEAARAYREAHPGATAEEANASAWEFGRQMLEAAIRDGKDFAFETTLGGNTIPLLLERAADGGIDVCIWYAGLASPELHMKRVRQRVLRGGHDIPEEMIRRRYESSLRNLIRLLPRLAAVRVYDNSVEADPGAGIRPRPVLVLHMDKGRLRGPKALDRTPDWAKPVVARAIEIHARRTSRG